MSFSRQVIRTLSGARYMRKPRRRGPSPCTNGLGMRPPGAGAVRYRGQLRDGYVSPQRTPRHVG